MSKYDVLDIRRSTITIDQADTRLIKLRKHTSTYTIDTFDFYINDKNIRDLIKLSNSSAPDNTTDLRDSMPLKVRRKYLNRLMGKSPGDLQSGRVALLTCPIDADLECGAVGCRIKFDEREHTVTWYDFAWDGNEDEPDLIDDESESESVKGLESYTFDEREYRWLMMQIWNDLDVAGTVEP